MSFLSNWLIRTKVIAAFALVLAVTLTLGLTAMHGLSGVNGAATDIRDNWLPGTRVLGDIAFNTMRFRQIQATLILASTDEARAKEAATLNTMLDTIAKGLKEYEPLITPGEERRLADAIMQGWAEYAALNSKLLQIASSGDQKAAYALYTGELRTTFNAKVMDILHSDIDLNHKGGIAAANDGAALYANAHGLIIGAMVLAALLCIVTGYLIVVGV